MVSADSTTKMCSKCGEVFPATTEFFHKNKLHSSGLRPDCKTCANQRVKAYYVDHQAERLSYAKDYRTDNPEKVRNIKRSWYDSNKHRKSDYDKVYRTQNKEKRRDQQRSWQRANAKKINQRRKQRRIEHPEIHKTTYLRWIAKNRDKVSKQKLEYAKTRRKENPEVSRTYVRRRRSRIHQLPDTMTLTLWSRCLEYWDNRCAVCGEIPAEGKMLVPDHWIPVSSSACPGSVPENIIPLCHGKGGCNNSKGGKLPLEWLHYRFNTSFAAVVLTRVQNYFEYIMFISE